MTTSTVVSRRNHHQPRPSGSVSSVTFALLASLLASRHGAEGYVIGVSPSTIRTPTTLAFTQRAVEGSSHATLHRKPAAKEEDNDSWLQESSAAFFPFADENEREISSSSSSSRISSGSSSSTALSAVTTTATPEVTSSSSSEMSLFAARGILLSVAAIWGTNFACVKYLEHLCFHPPCSHPPSEFAMARFGIAALVSAPLLVGQPLKVILAGLECGFWITLGYVTQSMALDSISAGKCAFLCSLTVVLVPVVSAVAYGKPLKSTDFIAGLIALSGVAVLEGLVDWQALLMPVAPALASNLGTNAIDVAVTTTTATTTATAAAVEASSSVTTAAAATLAAPPGPLGQVAQTLGISTGDLLALGQPVGFGLAFTRIEHYQEQFKDVPNRVLTIAAAQCVTVGLLSLWWVLWDYHGVFPNMEYLWEPHRIATLAWTGIITTVVAIYLEGIALQKASATDASIAFASEPVWASLFGFWLLQERLGPNAYVGGTIILTACLMGALSDLNATEEAE